MDETPNLELPYIVAAQAQKHVTHNEAIRALDAIVQIGAIDRDLAAPPGSPANGDRYIVAPSASGAWLGKESQIAAFQDGAWSFYAPREGLDRLGGGRGPTLRLGWRELGRGGGRQRQPHTARRHQRHRGYHKPPVAQFACVAVQSRRQTNFSGRAELGLAGDDDCHVKVSANGSTWHEAMVIDRTSGNVSFPNTPGLSGSGEANTSSNAGSGVGLAKSKAGVDLPFKSLVAGANIALTASADEVTIEASGGGGSPAGSDGQVQYNNGGSFGGATGVRWNDTSNKLEVDTSIELVATTGVNAGVLGQGGNPLLHTYGTHNLFICTNAGNFSLTGTENIGIGNLALLSLTSGSNNVAIGYVAGVSLTSGIGNFALGSQALANNIDANANVAIGYLALNGLTGGSGANIAIGQQAGYQLSMGASNVLLGTGAGAGITTGSNNIIIGPLGGLSSTLASTVIIAPGGTERMRIDSSGHTAFQGAVAPKSYTVATVPSAGAAGAGAMIYVSDESGGAVPAFSDGSDWRRVSDRAVIS